MLSCACFGYNSSLTHFVGEKDLAYGVIDLVCTSVTQILTFEKDVPSSEGFA